MNDVSSEPSAPRFDPLAEKKQKEDQETHLEPEGRDVGRLASSTNRLFEAAEPAPTDVEAEEKMSC